MWSELQMNRNSVMFSDWQEEKKECSLTTELNHTSLRINVQETGLYIKDVPQCFERKNKI